MALSIDLRQRIVKAYEQGEGWIRQLGKRFVVGEASVWRLILRYRKEGDVTPRSPPGRSKTLLKTHERLLKKWLDQQNDLTLRELQERLIKYKNVKVSLVTIHYACQHLKISYKKNAVSGGTRSSRYPTSTG